MEERKGLIRWIKKHKKELAIAGISIWALIVIALEIRNREMVKTARVLLMASAKQPAAKVSESVTNVIAEDPLVSLREAATAVETTIDRIPFEVSKHVRDLPEGRHASPEKIASALENDFVLMDGQTWVKSYMKGDAAA